MGSSSNKSTNWLLFIAIVILFSTGPLFWLIFSVFFDYPPEFGSNDSSQTLLDTNFRTNKEMQRQFELRREARRNGHCRNGWLNGFLCKEQQIKGKIGTQKIEAGLDSTEENENSKALIDGINETSNEASPIVPTVVHSFESTSNKKRPLRIAQIAPLAESIPPKLYGGTERIVYYLTEELVRQGHHVTLFCSNDSQTSAQEHISHESWPALRLNPVAMEIIPMMWMMEQVRQRAHEFDILHFHTIDYFPTIQPFVERTVTTLHGIMGFKDYDTLFKAYKNVPLISISDDQRVHLESDAPNYVGTVHHGIPADMFAFNPQTSSTILENGTIKANQSYLAFLGRITEVKRPEWAIEIAVRAGIPLKIAAKVDVVDVKFWEENVKPLVEKHSDLVEYIGEITDSEKGEFLGNALALLFPIDWPEPFGLVMIESLACGTPVIARPYGSVSEVIEDGVSGLIFNTIEEGVEAAKRVHQMERTEVRKAFERRFTVEKMVENYVKVYEKLLNPNDVEMEMENEKIEL